MAYLHFTSTIKIIGVNPYIIVTSEQATVLKPNWKKPMPVLVRINNQTTEPWHTNMMPRGDGSFYLYLHGEIRKASMTKVGDRVQINISFDIKYKGGPMHPMPILFSNNLKDNLSAKKAWDELTPSRKKEILRYFYSLKSDKVRKRNIEKAMRVLSGGVDRFMGRLWKEGK